jgi:hypothetical protein
MLRMLEKATNGQPQAMPGKDGSTSRLADDRTDRRTAPRMRMGPALRKLALATHLTVSVGWVGAVLGYIALDLTVASSQDPETVRAAWMAMGLVSSWVIVPLAFASLLTGLIMAIGTKWGLFRHWWVLISFLLTIAATGVLLSETRVIAEGVALAADPTTSADRLLATPSTLPHSAGGLVVLLVVQTLNVYKPSGLTPYGWRQLEEERRRDVQRRADGSSSRRGTDPA